MMDEYIIIKNALVLTFDRKKNTGYFNILIRNKKIFLIDFENKFNEKEFISKYPDAVIIDAKDKLVMPGIFNSRLISSYSLNKIFFKKCSYENINSMLSLKSIERFLSAEGNEALMNELLKISFQISLRNGELFLCENSNTFNRDFCKKYFTDTDWIKQYFNLAIYDYTLLQENNPSENIISIGFKSGEEINNYSLTSMKKALSGKKLKLIIEASLSGITYESLKADFGKPYMNVLSELELISPLTVIVNPTNINLYETEILKKKNASVLICPSDFINLSDKKSDLDRLMSSGLNVIVGTGYTGRSVLSELKILSSHISKSNLKYEHLMKTVTHNPSHIFGISNLTGSIERNKSADLIMFSLSDFRSQLTLPEIENEMLCEFIIQNLSEKEITDVILKGEILIRDRKDCAEFEETAFKKIKQISDKIYAAGNYFEYKEKYLMRGRVDKINIDNDKTEEKQEEIFVDMTETADIYLGEGEFTIIGAREEEFEKEREKNVPEVINLKEITSFEELDLFEGAESEIPEAEIRSRIRLSEPVKKSKEIIEHSKKSIKTDEELKMTETIPAPPLTEEEKKSETDPQENIEEKSALKLKKLKFGFGEEEK